MALTVKENTKVAVEIESTEGVYVAPTGANSFIQTLTDGTELTPAKELLERNVFNGSIGKSTPRTGMKSVTAAMPVEMRAGETEGSAPEMNPLLLSALGQTRSNASAFNSSTGHTTTQININDADIGKVKIGDIVVIKEPTAYHVSPVVAVSETLGSASFTMLRAMSAAPSNNVQISAFKTYYTGDSGHPSLSISKYIQDAVLEKAIGCRVTSVSLEGFETGQLANLNFSLDGMSFDRVLQAPGFTPSYDASLPPIILNACVYQDNQDLPVNSFSLSLENTLGFQTSTCSSNGRIGSRVTSRSITGSINPYKQDNSLTQFNHFKCGTEFSLFAFAYIPELDVNCNPNGEFGQVVAFYLPKCIITEISESDQDGLLVEEISWQASRGANGQTEELYIGFI
jgi:hypothetical protein